MDSGGGLFAAECAKRSDEAGEVDSNVWQDTRQLVLTRVGWGSTRIFTSQSTCTPLTRVVGAEYEVGGWKEDEWSGMGGQEFFWNIPRGLSFRGRAAKTLTRRGAKKMVERWHGVVEMLGF